MKGLTFRHRLWLFFLIALFAVLTVWTAAAESEIIDSGTCGKEDSSVTWSLSSDGTLRIAGEGSMATYYAVLSMEKNIPWYESRDTVRTLQIGADVTGVSINAFRICENLESILVDTDSASFCSDSGILYDKEKYTLLLCPQAIPMETLSLPLGLTTIEAYAFSKNKNLESVVFPYTVTSIGLRAFENCERLKQVKLPKGISSLPNFLFYGCSSLMQVDFPSSVIVVPNSMFQMCTSLEDVSFLSHITAIGNNAFNGCTALRELPFSDMLVRIGENAFLNCDVISVVNLPQGVAFIEANAFKNNGVTRFSVDENNATFASDANGILYNKEKTQMIQYPLGNPAERFTIPDGADIQTALSGSEHLKEVVLSDSMTSIPEKAFQNCTQLTNIPIHTNITAIGANAFAGCSALREITIPASVSVIDSGAFYGCTSLEEIHLPSSLSEISSQLFRDCVSLTEINLPSTISVIGFSAFSGCTNLTKIEIPKLVTRIWGSLFAGCTSLQQIVLPEGISDIGDTVFYKCSNLRSIQIPESVTSLGSAVFRESAIESIRIPKNISSIGEYAFYYCLNLKEIIVDEDNNWFCNDSIGALYNKAKTILVAYPCNSLAEKYSVPDTVQSTPTGSLTGTRHLKELVLPSGLSEELFQLCSYSAALERVFLSEGIPKVGGSMFYRCPSLKYVFLPSTITSIGTDAFEACPNLADIAYQGSEENWNSITIAASSFGTDGCRVHYNVPINDYRDLSFVLENDILSLSSGSNIPGGWHYWDADKASVTTVFVDGDFQSVDAGAFADCPGLTTVILDTESTAIADGAFENCPNLQAVMCFGGSSFGADAFDFEGVCKVYENADTSHTLSETQGNLVVVPYRFSAGTLSLLGEVSFESYEFFDTMAAFTLQYDDIQKLAFTRFTFDEIPMYFYPVEGKKTTQRVEDNTLINGEMYPLIYENDADTPITFNRLVTGIADKSITTFYLISSDENHKQIKDTPIVIENPPEEEDDPSGDDNEYSGIVGTIRKAMRWVITLLNKLFKILGKK